MKWICRQCHKERESKKPPKSKLCAKCWLENRGLKVVIIDGILHTKPIDK